MKILMVGGPTLYSYGLCEALANLGLDITLLFNETYYLDKYTKNFKVEKVFSSKAGYSKNLYALFKYVKHNNPDVLHLQWTFAPRKDWIFSYMIPHLKLKSILTVHNIISHEPASGEKFALKIIYRNFPFLWVHAHENKKRLVEEFGINSKKIKVVPHGDFSFYVKHFGNISKEAARRYLNLEDKDKVILFFGLIRRYKGLPYLITAFKKVVKEVPTAKLLIAGSPAGEDINRCYSLAEGLISSDKIIFHLKNIPHEDVSKYFIASDIVALPYIDITQSGLIQAAYAFGKPVVAASVGGLPEVLEDGKSGYLVPPGDQESLADVILKLLLNGKLIEDMGRYAKHLSQTKYSWENIAKSALGLYERMF